MKHHSRPWLKAARQSASRSLRLVLEPRMVFDAAVADTASIVEDIANVTGDVLTNDTGAGLTVQGVADGTPAGPLAGNVAGAVAGTYGSLTVQANGSYDYALNNASSTVQALAAGQTATDTFTYTTKNGANTPFTSTLTVTVTGANDAPSAIADTNSIAEDAVSITSNVLSNDTDVDTGDIKTVTAITGGEVGSPMTGTYGNLTLNADGSYTYKLDNTNAAVKALGAGHSLTETFTYTMKDAANATSSATLTITIDGITDTPIVTTDESSVNATAREIVFIEGNISQLQLLATGVRPGVQAIILDPARDGLDQIAEALSGKTDLSAIHIISHGSQGALQLGGMALNDAALQSHSADLAAIRASLATGGDLLLYGCDIGQGYAGVNFIGHLAQATGADVAASTDPTGYAMLGGNWILEQQTGTIEANSPLTDQAMAAYSALLVSPAITTPSALSINEDASYAFSGFNVTYAGAETNFEAVVTVTTAGSGNLVDGVVSDTQLASQGSLAAINAFLNGLQFQDASNWNGAANIDVTINVYNGNYSAGNLAATNSANFNVTVNPVNDAPAGTNKTISISEDGSKVFSAADFGFTDTIDSNTLSAVKITTTPLHGTLKNNGTTLTAGQSVSVADINAGYLVYTPIANANGTGYGNFTFQVQDNGGTLNGGADTDPSAKTMTIDVTAVNDTPTTTNASLSVNKNATLTFSLASSDVDGGTNSTTDAAVNQYKIDTVSANGILKDSSGNTLSAGSIITVAAATNMTFTPTTNYTGSTSFTFEAIDSAGLHSNASTVSITVNSVNQPPIITIPAAQSVNEDTSLTLSGLSLSDPDAGSAVVQATLSASHGNINFVSTTGLTVTAGANNSHSITVQGTINDINTALGSSNLRYTPDANYPNATAAATDTITIVANDLGNTGGGAQTDTKTITVTVNPVADAPVTGAATLAAVNEDTLDPAGASVSSLMSGHFTDVDGNTLAGIAISADATSASQGVWQYSANNGSSWQAVGDVSAGSALLLDATALLRFVPAANWNGTPGNLTIHAVDNSGSRTYTSTASRQTVNVSGNTDIDATGNSLGTSITSVADPFVYVNDSYLRVDEGGTSVLDSSILKITNVEASAAQIVYTVTGNTFSHGVMQLDSAHNGTWTTVVGNGTTFTQDDIDNGHLRYVHDGSEPAYAADQTLSYNVAEGGTSANRTLTIKISPVNDIPVLYTPGDTAPDTTVLSANVQKGSWLTFSTGNIQAVDPDNTNEQLVFRLESLPTHGILTYNGNAVAIGTIFNYANLSGLKYTHNNDSTSSDAFSVTLRDGAGGVVSARTIDLAIGIFNTAPTGIGNLSASIFEDPAANNGMAIKNFPGYSFSDADTGATIKGVAIVGGNTANPAAQGTWQYSTDGSHWADIGSVNDTTSALVLSPDTLVRFVPVSNYNGDPGALSVRALDNTYTGGTSVSNGSETRVTLDVTNRGGTTAISGNANTLGITVTAVNDDPVMATINSLDLGSGVYTATVTTSQLSATDVEGDTITYRLESRPTYGWLLLNGTPLGTGSIFTQADINSGKLTYQNYYNNSGTDGFNVTARDGEYNVQLNRPGGVYSGNTIQQLHVTVNITSQTGAPGGNGSTGGGGATGAVDGYGIGTTTVTGGGAGTPATAVNDVLYTSQNTPVTVYPSLLLNNDNGAGTLAITGVNAVPGSDHGIVAINGDGTITFTPETAFAGDGSFTYTFTDAENKTATATVTVHVLGVNDPLNKNLPLVLDEGSVAAITNTILQAPTADCVFTLGSTLPSNGYLYLDSTPGDGIGNATKLGFGDTFTQADIDAGKVKFAHNGSEDFISGFNFTLTDGSGNVLAKSIFNIDATPVNDTPAIGVSGAGTLGLGATYVFNSGSNVAIALADVDGSGDKTGATAFQSTNAELGFRVTTLAAHGTLQYYNGSAWVAITAGNMASTPIGKTDLTNGYFRYIQDGTNNFHDSFQITPDDSKGVLTAGQLSVGAPVTVSLNVVPANLYPVILNDTGLTVANGKAIYEGDTAIIHAADLMGTDPDNTDTQIQFRITSNVQYGQLLLNGQILGVGSAFTQDDLNNNRVSYKHDGLEGTTDSFSFRLSDGSGGNGIDSADLVEPPGTFNIDIIPVNDAPVVTVPGARTVAEEQTVTITGISIADPDSVNRALAIDNNFGPLLVTLSADHGVLTFGTTTGLTFVNGTANGAATIAVTGTLGALNTALGTLTYQGNANYIGSDTLTVRTDDLGHYGDVNRDATVTIGTAAAPGVDNLFDVKTVAITVTPVNDAPTLSGISANAYTEDAAAIVLASLANPADIDLDAFNSLNGNWGSATLTLSRSGGANAEDLFSNSGTLGTLTQGGNLTLGGVTKGTVTTNSNGTLKLTFADGVTTAEVQSVLQQIAYSNSRQSLAAGQTASVALAWVLDDGDTDPDRANNGQGTGGHLFVSVNQTITLTGVNDAPTGSGVASITPASLTATEDVTAGVAGDTVANLFTAKYSDSDASNSLGGIAITANSSVASEGHWEYSTNNGASWTQIANNGSITTANALVLSATDKIRFLPDASNYNGTPGSLTLRLIDNSATVASASFVDVSDDAAKSGGATQYSNSSNAVTLNATVTAVNDAPTISGNKTVSDGVTESSPIVISSAGTIPSVVADIEATRIAGGEGGADKGKVSVTVAVANGLTHGKITLGSTGNVTITAGADNSNTVTIKGLLSDINAALDGLSFTPGDNANTSEDVTVTVDDLGNSGTTTTAGSKLTATQTITITNIAQINDAPTATGNATLTAVNEDAGAAANIPNYGNLAAATGATVSSLFNAKFSDVDTTSSSHTFSGIAITGNAEDGTHGHWEYSTDSGASWTQIPTAGLSDTAALVIGSAANNMIRFNPDTADYNGTPGALTVRLSDGKSFVTSTNALDLKLLATGITDGWSNAISLTTSVTQVNDAPIISNLDGDNVAFVEAVGVNVAGIAVYIDNGGNASLGDIDLITRTETTFNGATLTVRDHLGADSNDFFVIQTGVNNISISGGFTTPSGLKLFNSGSSINYNGVSVAAITNNSSTGTLVLTFNANATGAAVDAILHNLAYSNNKDALTAGTKDIDIIFKDGNATQANNVQGSGGELSTTATVHITLSPSNDAPSFTAGATISDNEDVTPLPLVQSTLGSLLGGANFTDPDGGGNLAGVAVSAYSDKSNNAQILGSWQVSFDSGTTWTNLSDLSTTAGGISASKALLLSANTMVQFVPDANANTAGLATPPRLTVFAVEDGIPVGASAVNAPAITFSTAAGTLVTYDTTADTLEARVSAASVNIDVQITPINDAPVVTATATNPNLNENSSTASGLSIDPVLLLNSGVTVADVDLATNANLTSTIFGHGTITVSLHNSGYTASDYVTGDVLFVAGTLPSGVTTSGGTAGDLTITLANGTTLAEVKTILENIAYKNTGDNPTVSQTNTDRHYRIVVNDGNNVQAGGNAGGPAKSSANIDGVLTISPTNDAPIVDLNGGSAGNDNTVTFTEGANTANTPAYIAAASGTLLSDVDNANLTQMVITVGGLLDGNNEVLNIDGTQFQLATDRTVTNSTSHFDIAYAGGIFTITKNGAAIDSVANFQTLLRGITYDTLTDTPTAGARTFDVQVTDAGVDDAGNAATKLDSNLPRTTLTVVPANDQPRLTNLSSSVSFHENALQAGADWLDQSVTLTELDGANYNNGTITISGLAAADIVSLPSAPSATLGNVQWTGVNGGNVQYHDGSSWVTVGTATGGTAGNFVVTLNSSATPAIAQRIIENLTFRNTSDAPATTRTLTYTVNDGSAGGSVLGATLGVTIIRDNDAPVMSAASLGGTYTERSATGLQLVNGTVGSTILVSDPDSPTNFNGGSLTVSLSGYQTGDTLSVLNDSTAAGHISVSGNTVSFGNVSFAGTSGGNGNDLVITFNSTAAPAAVQALLAQLRYSNTANDNPTHYGAAPTRNFTITLNDGANTHDAAADVPGALTATLSGTITVTPTADAPVIGASNAIFTEGGSAVTLSPALTLTDADDTQATGATVQISANLQTAYDSLAVAGTVLGNTIGGTNITVTGYDSSTGTLTLSGTDTLANYQAALRTVTFSNSNEDPAGNNLTGTRTLTWSVTDANSNNIGGSGATGTTTSTVTLYPVNDAPIISELDATSANTYVQGGAAVIIDSNATLGDYELAVRDNWAGAKLTIARSTGASTDDVLGASGTSSSGLYLNAGNIQVDGTTVGTYTNSGGTLTMTFGATATTALVNKALQGITYANAITTAGSLGYNSVILRVGIDDQNTDTTGGGTAGTATGAQKQGSGGLKTATQDIVVNINRRPIANADTGSVSEGVLTSDATTVSGDVTPAGTAGGNVLDTDQDGDTLTVQGVQAGTQSGPLTGSVNTAVNGSYGSVNIAADGSYTYAVDNTNAAIQHLAIGETKTDTFSYTISDGRGGTSTTTLTITINGTNDAPVLSDTALTVTQAEDDGIPGSGTAGTLVSALAGGSNIADLDAGNPKGIAITATDSTHGTWYYSTTAAPSWTAFTATGNSALLLAADANTRIYFKPTGDWHGSITGALTIRAWDTTSGSNGSTAGLSNAGSSTGGTTAFSTATDSVDLTITPINDAPTLSGSTTLAATNEDTTSSATAATIAGALTYGDAADDQTGNGGNSTATARTALAIVGNAATAGQGVWQYTTDGSSWNTISTTIGNTTAVVLDLGNTNHQIRFVPATDYNGTPGVLTLRVADGSWNSATGIQNINAAVGGTGAWSSGTGTLGITVNALNDAPTVSGLNATPTFVEGIDTAGNRTVIGTPIILDSSVTIGDIEIVTQAVDNFSGTTLTIARDNGSGSFSANAQDIFGLDTTGTVSIAGTVISVSGTAMADITSNSGGQLLITFRSAATSAQVNTVVSAVTYALNSDTPPANVTLRYRFNDDNQAAAQGSGGSLTGDATITVGITAQNDIPLAVDDTNAITEDAMPNTTTGNVITGIGSPNTSADSDPENDTLTITALRTGAEGAGGSTTAVTSGTTSANGTLLAGSYGSITLGADGSYSYALDNANVTVNALRNGQTLTETFTYTLSDGHSGTDTAQITITISGNSDGAPSIVPVDGNGAAIGQVTVNESGLTGIGDTTETNTGSVTLSAADGLTSINVGGTTVTLAQLNALGSTPVVINTSKGAITLTGYTSTSNVGGVSTGGTLAYRYTLSQVQTTPAATGNSDAIALTITDAGGGSANGTLTVRIVDDVPTANADANSVNEGTTLAATTTTGNVFGATGATAGDVADRIGADNTATPVTAVSFGGNAKTVGTVFNSTYGSLILNADGSYSYALDNANVTVNALRNGQTLTETFTYTITDADGDTGSTTLVITINGVTDGAPSIVPVDGNGAATGQVTVNESGLTSVGDTTETHTGSITLSAADGLTSINVGGTTVTLAQLNALGSTPVVINTPKGAITLTGYTSTSNVGGVSTGGTLAYSYTLSQVQTTPAATGNSDAIALTIADAGGGSANGTLTVRIVDDVPTANADANSVNEGTTLAATATTGNVFGATGATAGDVADRIGADNTATPVTAVSFGGNAKTVGTVFNSAYGSLTLNADGSYSYSLDNANVTVNALKNGQTLTETFTYTITDADGDTSSTNLVITINGINDAPVAKPDTNTVNENAILTVITANGVIQSGTVLTGVDTDVESDTLTVIGVKTGIVADVAAVGTANIAGTLTGTYGTLTLAANGSYVYAADQAVTDRLGLGVTATDTFSYAISDGNGGTAFTTLVITVTGTNDAPTTVGLLPPVTQADSTMVSLTTAGGFADPDSNNIFTYSASGLPAGLSIDANTGMISGTLAHDASQGGVDGVHTVVVTVTDSQGVPVSQTFSFTVTNPAPVANPDTNAVNESSTLTVNAANGVIRSGGAPTGTDTDADGDTLTVIGVKSGTAANAAAVGTSNVGSAVRGTYGTLTLAADGSYTYQANAVDVSAIVTDTFSYAISDGNGGISFTTLVISVTGTGKAPNAPEGSVIQLANSPSSSSASDTVQDSSTANPTFTSTGSSNSQNSGATVTDGEDKSPSEGRQSTKTGDSIHYELELTGSLKNQLVLENKEFSFRIPNGVFTHTNPNEHLSFKATSPSGGALPSWIHFDPNTKTFSGVPPVGSKTETVLVIVKDSNGKEVSANFTIGVNKEDSTQTSPLRQADSKPKIIKPQARISNFDTISGKPGLTEQVHAVGRLSRLQESRALLDSLKQL